MNYQIPSASVLAVDSDLDMEMEFELDLDGAAEASVSELVAIEREEFNELVALESSPSGMLSKLVYGAQLILRQARHGHVDYEFVSDWMTLSRTIRYTQWEYLTDFEAGQYRDAVGQVGAMIFLPAMEERTKSLIARLSTATPESVPSNDSELRDFTHLLHEIGGHFLGVMDTASAGRFTVCLNSVMAMFSGSLRK